MLKIVDVDWITGYTLELEFSDGYRGVADLEAIFALKPLVALPTLLNSL